MAPRDHYRTQARVPVRIDAVLRQQGAITRSVTIRNLGFGGAGIELADPTIQTSAQAASAHAALATGAPVVLEVVAPVLWDPLYLPGQVAWSVDSSSAERPSRAGIRFDPLEAITLLSLFDVLTST